MLPENAVLAVDGHVILNFARQSIPTFRAGHRLNSGPFGCLGVGVPFGLGAKVALPDDPVVVLTGDGSFGFNAMEMDTAMRHKLPIVVVISNNGGWAAETQRAAGPGATSASPATTRCSPRSASMRNMSTQPGEIRPALERALASGTPGHGQCHHRSEDRAQTVAFATYGAI